MSVRPWWAVNRRGITRTVLLIDRWAIKVPSLRGGCASGPRLRGLLWSISRGVIANQDEATMCRWGDLAGVVCPVRWSLLGGLVNVYPRCAPLPLGRVGEAPALPYSGDKKPDNLGLLAGRVVWLDYDASWNHCNHGYTPAPAPLSAAT